MRPAYTCALGLVVVHAIAVTALHWPEWWFGLLALLCWGFAAIGALEPRPTTSRRHPDVRAAERTRLGRILLYREGWIIERPALALALLVTLSLLAPTAFVALTPADETSHQLARIYTWSPALLLSAGTIIAGTLNAWLATGPILLLWLLFVIASAANGDHETLTRLLAAAAAVVASVFSIDLLRGTRRALERRPNNDRQPEAPVTRATPHTAIGTRATPGGTTGSGTTGDGTTGPHAPP